MGKESFPRRMLNIEMLETVHERNNGDLGINQVADFCFRAMMFLLGAVLKMIELGI